MVDSNRTISVITLNVSGLKAKNVTIDKIKHDLTIFFL